MMFKIPEKFHKYVLRIVSFFIAGETLHRCTLDILNNGIRFHFLSTRSK